MWWCVCECGNKRAVDRNSLRDGSSRSCGCWNAEQPIKHGKSYTRLYRIWAAMKSRCTNAKDSAFKHYGGRGITLCPEWLDFENFEKWSFKSGYNENAIFFECTLDRIDVNGNYEPNNCRWVDMKTQLNNTRRNQYINYEGQKLTVSQWAEKKKIPFGRLYDRIFIRKWSIEKAFNTPVKTK